ncbi:MAG: 3-phosphoglycerate dehydrogenase, partial [Eggerthellaceae bacterium]|nr:3-phosphoglycerate dehydrogenase [Eggerthellaceae bacterium]
MPRIHCLNNISKKGTDQLPENYELVDELANADGVLVRSAQLHDTAFPKSLLAIGRAGAGVNNIP